MWKADIKFLKKHQSNTDLINVADRDILYGSVPLTNDPDLDPAIFVSDLQDANNILFLFF